MDNFPNCNQLRGRATGSIFFACFGAAWLFLGFAARQLLHPVMFVEILTGTVALLIAAFYLIHRAKQWPRLPNAPAIGRKFAVINAIQWIAIAVVAFVLARIRLETYVPAAIAGIIGLHMFPLARLFRYPLHNATGVLLVGWSIATIAFLPAANAAGTVAIGTGVILWLSAVVMLANGLRAAETRIPSLAGEQGPLSKQSQGSSSPAS